MVDGGFDGFWIGLEQNLTTTIWDWILPGGLKPMLVSLTILI